jgi:hypothetical protein
MKPWKYKEHGMSHEAFVAGKSGSTLPMKKPANRLAAKYE